MSPDDDGDLPAEPTTPEATPPTPVSRRGFLGTLAVAAGAAVAVTAEKPGPDADRPRSTWTGKTRWIGHC